jgi:hypothetical protein
MYGSRTEMQTPAVDCGSYVIQYEIRHEENQNYVIIGEPVHEKSFTITQKVIDVSGVMLKGESSISYDGKDHTPILEGLPEHAEVDTMIVTRDEQPVSESVNAGQYRCEVTLKPETANYKLSSTATISMNYKIIPKEIDVDNLTFDSLEFTYNGESQRPELNVPDHVLIADVQLYDSAEENELEETIDIGQYICVVTLAPADSNYVLSDTKTYKATYEIKKIVIDLDALFGEELLFEYDGGDQRDRPFLELGDLVNYQIEDFYTGVNIYRPNENSEWQEMPSIVVLDRGHYKLLYKVTLKDSDHYTIRYNGAEVDSANVNVQFKIV